MKIKKTLWQLIIPTALQSLENSKTGKMLLYLHLIFYSVWILHMLLAGVVTYIVARDYGVGLGFIFFVPPLFIFISYFIQIKILKLFNLINKD